MKYIISKLVFLGIGILLFQACVEDSDLNFRMSQFDKAFVPVWYFAYTDQAKAAEKAAFHLAEEWDNLRSDYQDVIGLQVDWTETYACIDDFMVQALQNIEYHETENALIDLEYIKFELMGLRARYDIDYYLDNVWEFQSAYSLVKELAATGYYFKEWGEFDCLVNEMNDSWELLQSADYTQLWTSTQFDQLEDYKTQISQQLAAFNYDLANLSIENESATLSADQIELPLLEMIKLFGAFEPSTLVGQVE